MKEENKKKNEELQSRRQFFKKAGKAALPILGMVVLSNFPSNALAQVNDSNGCTTCSTSCGTSCFRAGCGSYCTGGCSGSCKGSCEGTLKKL